MQILFSNQRANSIIPNIHHVAISEDTQSVPFLNSLLNRQLTSDHKLPEKKFSLDDDL